MENEKTIKKVNSPKTNSTITKPRRVSIGDVIKGKSTSQIQHKTIEVRHEAKLERARLNTIRYVLNRFSYNDKDVNNIGKLDSLIVGRSIVIYEKGEKRSNEVTSL
jgi:hypothetical protein